MSSNSSARMDKQTSVAIEDPQEWASAVKCATLLTILVMTLASNFFVLFAVLLRPSSRTGSGGLEKASSLSRVQLFMVHLSIADILVALLNITPQLAWVITVDFRGGVVLCKGVAYAQVLVLYLSTYILTGMSLDRLISMRAIYSQWRLGMRPSTSSASSDGSTSRSLPQRSSKIERFNNHHSRVEYRKFAKAFICLAWLIAAVLALPQLYIFSYVPLQPAPPTNSSAPAQPRYNCLANFSFHPHGKQIYVTSFVVFILGLPVTVMLASYGYMCAIILRIQRSYEQDPTNCLAQATPATGGFAASSARLTAAKIRLVKMTFSVVLCFIVCWSPFCLAELVGAFVVADDGTAHHAGALLIVCMLLAALNSAVNPWIYAAFYATGRRSRKKRPDKSITSSEITRSVESEMD